MFICSDYAIISQLEELLLFKKLRAQARHLQLCPRVALAPHGQMDQHRRGWICLVSDVRRQESSGGCRPQSKSKVWCCEVSGDESRSALSLQRNKLQHLPPQSSWLLPQASLPPFWKETILCSSENLGLVRVGPSSHYSSSGRDPKQIFAFGDFSVVASSDLHFSRGKHWNVSGFHLRHMSACFCWHLFVHCQTLGWHATERLQHCACHWSQLLSSAAAYGRNQRQFGAGVDHTEEPFRQLIARAATDLESNYQLAKCHMNIFQTVVCEPLANTGLEVIAKIKSLTELDKREGGADILFCEVWCDSLQEVQDAWDMLNDLDGVEIVSARDFFAVASYKKNCKVVVSLQGYLTTVVLLEKSLSSWEAQKGLSDAADSLGLLDETKASAWEASRLQRDATVPRCVFVATALLRLVALFSCLIIIEQIGLYYCNLTAENFSCRELDLRMLALNLPFLTCFLILLWEMQCCCCCCLCCCKRRRSFKIRPRPTQLWYRRYLGVQGCYYAFKVAALQFLTVVMQGLAKASLFRTIQDTRGSAALQASTAVHCFMVLLLCNILFPAMILVIPNYVFSRVGAALLDAVLDVGYMVTSIWLYVVFATNYLTDMFLSSFLNYMSIYICVAHVLCVCRSLETADWIALFQVPRAPPTGKAWKRILFSTAYVAFVSSLLGGIILGASLDTSHAGLCPPCKCSTVAPTSLLLERCVIPTSYVAQAAVGRLEFNLTNRNITEVLPDAFIARGAHQKVRSISLRGNHLTELPEGHFRDLLQQEEDRWRNDIVTDIDTLDVDLADNRIATLPPGLFQAGSSGESTVIGDLHLEGNCLTTLPPGVFHGLTFGYRRILNISHNQLQVLPPKVFDGLKLNQLSLQSNVLSRLHAETFHGLTFGWYGILDMSQNKLQELHADAFHGLTCGHRGILNISHNQLQVLPPKVFDGLTLNRLYLQNNDLSQLHAETFRGLTFSQNGILDMSQNKLQDLPPKVFDSLELYRLYLQNNVLSQLHAEAFQNLTFGHNSILDMSQNKLQELHADAFHGLTFGYYGRLDMSQNKLQELHADAFHGLTFGSHGRLDISHNKLQELPPKVFDGLKLNQLSLQSNVLSRLHAETFHGLTFSWNGILDISRNKLQDLPPKVFNCTARLEILDLADNELSTLSDDVFYGLSDLRSLRLEGNRLRSLGDRPFYQLYHLEELHLAQNLLEDLDDHVFDSLSVSVCYSAGCVHHSLKRRLLELHLGGNRLTALHDGLFKGFRSLRTLQLQSNQLARLPKQLFQFPGKVYGVIEFPSMWWKTILWKGSVGINHNLNFHSSHHFFQRNKTGDHFTLYSMTSMTACNLLWIPKVRQGLHSSGFSNTLTCCVGDFGWFWWVYS